ncbi:gamma-glutamyl-gamma-aminobutyrate hydrolase family protein [Calderihabitans maritimus]|uniref:Peptidase C26 n=1 Tax=Calderihabitans maritimus TaxID=1246530 RepID=A0A1Z5HSL2_9FIRM|nr:gamma-glutamyl-gamma-aminobutyrate hydrolase family protein [Calderihabitans maritimus]GAW92516.1 peptidase C26 [Calderihabitans maritimus]
MPPLIGITCSHDLQENRYYLRVNYCRVIEACGGLPFILPAVTTKELIKNYCERLDGLILSGGGDVDPTFFGEEPLPGCGKIDPERDYWEINLVQKWLTTGKPLLAICRGMQVLNIAAGGDIYQDIYSQLSVTIKHQQEAPPWHPTHHVSIIPDTKLYSIMGKLSWRVNTFHHQAIRRPAPGFTVSARAADGVVEALEATSFGFVIGVQWHPECMWKRDPKAKALFETFVKECKN